MFSLNDKHKTTKQTHEIKYFTFIIIVHTLTAEPVLLTSSFILMYFHQPAQGLQMSLNG